MNKRLEQLLRKYLEANISEAEEAELSDYINNPVFATEIKEQLGEAYTNHISDDIEFSETKQKDIFEYIYAYPIHEPPVRRLWPRIAVAVAAAVVIFGAGLFIYQSTQPEQLEASVYANDIAPGKTGATLTLANGKKIRLTDAANGQLAKQAGVTVSKTANGQLIYEINPSEQVNTNLAAINTLSTARGETYQLRLPDGSMVWLNAASSLSYAANLQKNGKRRVKLEGEGYFEIAKDAKHPFIVESRDQQVEVLGTHFNINAYSDEAAIKTTLLEGSVKVANHSSEQKLQPGFEALNSGDAIRVNRADTEVAVAWKNELFLFESENIHGLMRKISRWYDVEIIYHGAQPTDTFSGGVSRFDKLSKVLKSMESSGRVHFRVEGRKVFVSQ